MSLAQELSARGYIYQYSADSVEDIFDGPPRTVYLGIDPTADSMHVGHLVPYMMLNHIMNHGHSVIALLGGGTALIGDPSFKDQERDIAEVDTIQKQCAGLEKNVRAITTSENIQFVNNYDWLSQLSAIEFLRDVGKHFTVNAMVKKDSVAKRFATETGISYTEFSYSLLQAYDFYHLYQTYGCEVQIGGSDQWGNIIAGVDYVRRRTGAEVHGVTMQLITDRATGKKFGKSEGNAVWLDPEKTSPFAFYQFWFNTSDESVADYLKLFTMLTLAEIDEVVAAHTEDPAARYAQTVLARSVTSFIHGADSAQRVERASQALFGMVLPSELADEELAILKADAPMVTVAGGTVITEVLVTAGLASSKREARTFVSDGAVMVDATVVTDPAAPIEKTTSAVRRIKRGKKRVSLLAVE